MHNVRSTRSGLLSAAFGIVLLTAPSAEPLRADDAPPLPETSGSHGWFQKQRIRFHNNRLFAQAQTAILRGEYAVAGQRLADALAVDPGSNRAKRMLIEVHEQTGAWEAAITLCDDLLASYPHYVEGHLQKAFFALRQRNHELAIASFEEVRARANEHDPRHALAGKHLVHLYAAAGKHALATELGREQLRTEDSFDVRLLLAECAIAQHDAAHALPHLDAALRLADTPERRGEVRLKQGYLYYDQGDFQKADDALRDAAALLPDKVDRLQVTRQMAESAMKQRDFGRAAERFETFLRERFDEHVAAAHVDALLALGAHERAVHAAETYRRHKDAGADLRKKALWHLVHLHKTLKNPAAAYEAAQELHALEPGDDILLELASAAEGIDDKNRAVEHYQEYLGRQFRADAAMACYYLLKNLHRMEEGETLLARVVDGEDVAPAVRTEATYEMAQIRRAQGRLNEYFDIMKTVTAHDGNQRFLIEYADLLLGAGRYEAALQVYQKLLDEDDLNDDDRRRVCRNTAEIYLATDHPEESRTWLQAALRHGPADVSWHLLMARLDYRVGNFDACVERLLTLDEADDVTHLYLGFSFYRMNMPGLAHHHLNLVASPEQLPPDQRYNLYANLAYLSYDQGIHTQTLDHVERALSLRVSDDMPLIHIKTRIALGRYAEAADSAVATIAARDTDLRERVAAVARRHPDSALKFALLDAFSQPVPRVRAALVHRLRRHEDSALKGEIMMLLAEPQTAYFAEWLELAGVCQRRLGRHEQAVDLLSSCLDLDPLRFEARYQRGLAHHQHGELEQAEADFIAYQRSAAAVSRLFWADFGTVEGKLGKYGDGTAALTRSLDHYRYDIDTMEESGYQFMKWPNNTKAKASFTRAIDTYSETLPYLAGEARDEYLNNRTALKREYGKLDRLLGGQVYFSKTDYDLPEGTSVSSMDGALPSQAGVELNLRPPGIGFRDERTLDVFGRVLGNLDRDAWRVDADSYQGGVGLRYKPLRRWNAVASIERLVRIGDRSENNWLARALASREWGEKPSGTQAVRPAGKLYGDTGCFLEEHKRQYYYLDARAGLAWNLNRRILVTFPQFMGIARNESDDTSGLLSYTLAGVGCNGRILEPERRYVTERWYLDACAHYVWGWFRDVPAGLEDTSFEGIVFGLNFVK